VLQLHQASSSLAGHNVDNADIPVSPKQYSYYCGFINSARCVQQASINHEEEIDKTLLFTASACTSIQDQNNTTVSIKDFSNYSLQNYKILSNKKKKG
jgi:hypothetical protein